MQRWSLPVSLALGLIFLTACSGDFVVQQRASLSSISRHGVHLASLFGSPIPGGAETAIIGGSVIDESGQRFVAPGATISVLHRNDQGGIDWYGPSFLPFFQPFGGESVMSGDLEIGVNIPIGYVAQYSVCFNAFCPHDQFLNLDHAGGVRVHVPAGSVFDIQFKMVRSGDSAPSDLNQKITCNYDGGAVTPTTDEQTFMGADAGVRIAISRDFGGVASAFELINASNGQKLDIVDARSAAGASWQFSFGGQAPNDPRVIAFNQTAGNAFFQWGASGTYNGLNQTDWSPLWSDHELDHDYDNGATAPVGTNHSPCYNIGYHTFDSQLHINGVQTASGAVQVTTQIQLRASMDLYWERWQEEHAFYLSRAAAVQGDLRFYAVSRDTTSRPFINGGAAIAPWSEGPIRPYNDFTSTHRTYPFSAPDVPVQSSEFYPINYAIFVYRVGGRDIAMAVSRTAQAEQPFINTLVLTKDKGFSECRDLSNPACGGMEFHSHLKFYREHASLAVAKGQVYNVQAVYTIGTLAQLAALGFTLGPSSSAAISGFFQVPGDSAIYWANGNDAFCAKSTYDDYLNSGGARDGSNVSHLGAFPAGMRNDGLCAKVPVPRGFFQVPGNGTIYHSDGVSSYCGILHWEWYLAAGGQPDLSNVLQLSDGPLPPNMSNAGNCPAP